MLIQRKRKGISGALLALITFSALISLAFGQNEYPNKAESSKETCVQTKKDSFYETVIMQCKSCNTNSQKSPQDVNKCICKDGFKFSEDQVTLFNPTCTKCGTGEATSLDGTKCLQCTDASVELITGSNVDIGGSKCICKNPDSYIKEEGNAFKCEACPALPLPNTDNKQFWRRPRSEPMTQCQRCPGEGFIYDEAIGQDRDTRIAECICDQTRLYEPAGGICIAREDYNKRANGKVVDTLVEMPNNIKVQSDTLKYLGLKALIGCSEYNNVKDCQMAANLCVLTNYDQAGSAFCREHLALIRDRSKVRGNFYDNDGYKQGLPWLYYWKGSSSQDPDEVLKKSEKVKFRASFVENSPAKKILNKLTFKLAAYSLEGEFLGWQDLTDQLFVCEVHEEDLEKFDIGTTIEKKCLFDLAQLTNEITFPHYTNIFFDLFLVDYNNDLVDVPVRINGEKELYRRFFIFDTVSGLQDVNSYIEKGTPAYLRWAKSVRLKIQLDPEIPERIYVPVLDITYDAIVTEDIKIGPVERYPEVYYRTEYTMETDGFWEFAETIFWILFSLTIASLLFKIYVTANAERLDTSLNDNQGSTQADQTYLLVKVVTIAIEKFSNILFWYLVAMSAWWFIFFKFQARVVVFFPELPDEGTNSSEASFAKNYQPYDKMLACVTVFKIVALAYKIYFEQSKQDIFFIDWETPKDYQLAGMPPIKGVSPWRRLFVANEFNELQTERLLTPDFMLLLFLVIAEGFGLKYFSQLEVAFSVIETGTYIDNILMFFIIFAILFAAGTVNYFFQNAIAIWNPPAYLDFIDLCSISNISIIIFNEELDGYYIHGRSPNGSADVGAKRLSLNLEAEKDGNANVRGIHNSKTYENEQHFELFLPPQMIQDYRKHFLTKVLQMINKTNESNQANFNEVQRTFTLGKALPDKLDIQELFEHENFTMKIMKQYIDKVSSEPSQFIQRKTSWDRFMNNKPRGQKFPIMYFDSFIPSFTNAFLYGLEFDFCMVQVLVIASLYRMSGLEPNNVMSKLVLGVLIAHLIDGLLVLIRKIYGARNLCVHTLVDERFLVD